MKRFRSKLGAWWLLLLLGRVLAPEAALLHLHGHHHTVDAYPPLAVRQTSRPQAFFSPHHHHCHEVQLYDAPFTAAGSPVLPQPRQTVDYPTYYPLLAECPARHLLPGAALRGPPGA